MAHTAYVYRTEIGQHPEYVGRVELETALQPQGLNSYVHRREKHVIHVDRIEPASSKSGDVTIPTVYGSNPEVPDPVQRSRKLA